MNYMSNIMLGNEPLLIRGYGNNGRKYFFIHDSYGFGYTPGSSTQNGWYNWVTKYLGLQKEVNAFHVGYGVIPGGYGMAPTVGTEHAGWADVLRKMDMSNIPTDEITDVVIFGGTNDYAYVNSISAGMADLNTVIRSTFPNARILLGVYAMALPISTFGSHTAGTLGVYEQYKRCVQYGWAFAANTVWCLHKRSYMSSDNIHPTQEAYQESSYYLAQAIMQGDCDVDWYSFHNPLPASNVNVINKATFHFRFKNGVWTIAIDGTAMGYMDNAFVAEVTSGNPQGHYQIAAIPDFCIPPEITKNNFPIIARACNPGRSFSATLQLRDNMIQLDINAVALNTRAEFLEPACSGLGWMF